MNNLCSSPTRFQGTSRHLVRVQAVAYSTRMRDDHVGIPPTGCEKPLHASAGSPRFDATHHVAVFLEARRRAIIRMRLGAAAPVWRLNGSSHRNLPLGIGSAPLAGDQRAAASTRRQLGSSTRTPFAASMRSRNSRPRSRPAELSRSLSVGTLRHRTSQVRGDSSSKGPTQRGGAGGIAMPRRWASTPAPSRSSAFANNVASSRCPPP